MKEKIERERIEGKIIGVYDRHGHNINDIYFNHFQGYDVKKIQSIEGGKHYSTGPIRVYISC